MRGVVFYSGEWFIHVRRVSRCSVVIKNHEWNTVLLLLLLVVEETLLFFIYSVNFDDYMTTNYWLLTTLYIMILWAGTAVCVVELCQEDDELYKDFHNSVPPHSAITAELIDHPGLE